MIIQIDPFTQSMKSFFKIFVVLIMIYNTTYSQQVTWQRYYDFFQSETCSDILQTYDGGYTLLVTMGSIELIKIDTIGELEWYKILDSSYTKYGRLGAISFQQTSDSGYIVAGSDDSTRAFLFKFDKTGNLTWRKYFTNPGFQSRFWSLKITNDFGFIACGEIYNSSNSKSYIVKTDSLGNLEWSKVFVELTNNIALDIISSKEGNYFFVGSSSSSSNSTGVLKKLNSYGDIIWNKYFFPGGRKLVQNEYGFLYTGGGLGILYVNKFDTTGNQIWQRSYSTGGYYFGLTLTVNDNFVFSGGITNSAGSDVIATRFDSSGNLIQNVTINSGNDFFDASNAIRNTNDNGFIIGGKTIFGGSSLNYNALAIKTDSLLNAPKIVGIVNDKIEIKDYSLVQNYPNPFNGETILKYIIRKSGIVRIDVYDILGKEKSKLFNSNQQPGIYSIKLNVNNFKSGIYFYRMFVDEQLIDCKKMIVLK